MPATGLTTGGRVPKATKKARGTLRHDRDDGKVDVPAMAVIPQPLDLWGFSAEQHRVWMTVVTTLRDMGVLYEVSLELIRMYVIEVHRYHQAQAEIERNGLVIDSAESRKKNPAVDVANSSFMKIMNIAGHFGFTPATATRIKGPTKAEIDNHDGFDF